MVWPLALLLKSRVGDVELGGGEGVAPLTIGDSASAKSGKKLGQYPP